MLWLYHPQVRICLGHHAVTGSEAPGKAMRVLEVTLTLTLDPTPTHPNPSPNLSSNPNPHPNVGPLQVSDTSERGPLGASEHLHVLLQHV